MRTHRLRQVLVLCSMLFAIAMAGPGAASADVNCADLISQEAAQAYLQANPADLDHLDGNGNGRACEANDPHSYGRWSLPGLAALMLGALVLNGVMAKRATRSRVESSVPGSVPARRIPAQRIPAQRIAVQRIAVQRIAVQQSTGILTAQDREQPLLDAAPDGSIDELGRALRAVPGDKRMSLVELYAVAHHSSPAEVLDALVAQVSDVRTQRWASTRRADRSDHRSS